MKKRNAILGPVWLGLCILILSLIFTGFQSRHYPMVSAHMDLQEEPDSIIWQNAVLFTKLFNQGDSAAMNKYLPANFMLQLMHENFLGKKTFLLAMKDTAVQATFMHTLRRDVNTIIRYSDDKKTAGLNVAVDFINPNMAESIRKERGYGLSIMYFQKMNDLWRLQSVHLDIHCSLCNE